ncbi:Granule-bound starch synthase 1 chloroplastic/amyloplastic [Zea mays]|uniref:Granule-bound starch synthase 1 chloroplastic/amyloplastic n=1 Tax=Zea mays TaxID=4577 RepID=A0A1D6L1M5_MAIZE|nr:Granule-bound starch synthase 1 chloroplastic/amyloplastic [Zea mays]
MTWIRGGPSSLDSQNIAAAIDDSCHAFLAAVRSSCAFRRRFRALHPPPLLDFFFDPDGNENPAFMPIRRGSDRGHAATVRDLDALLTPRPGEDVVFVANDWHTAILPCYMNSMYKPNGILLMGRKLNWMKAEIIESDLVLTVSPHYIKELTSGPHKGVELDGVLRAKPLEIGIVNGMDVYEWDPSTDKYISVKYDATMVTEARSLNKERLQAEVGLPVDSSIPVIVFVGCLEEQKGSDILIVAIPEFVGENVQIIVLVWHGKEEDGGIAKFNVPLAHMMFARADFIIVPSRFEPCGLIQLQGMRYGVIPICSSIGGFVDTVEEGVTGFHMGSCNVETQPT